MTGADLVYDAIIIGGGFYGTVIAAYLVRERGLKRLLLLEQEDALLQRASYNNQARVHNGYHYPRNFTTAYRSRINLPRFVSDWPAAIKQDFVKLYAIARRNSKVTAKQFERFCKEIGAKIDVAEDGLRALFEPRLIEEVFLVEEYAFDANKLAEWAAQELNACGVNVRLGTRVTKIFQEGADRLRVLTQTAREEEEHFGCRYVFNCTYSGLNQFGGDYQGTHTRLKHEITEMLLMQAPPAIEGLGVTVMDGPFFSMMPFPARGLHSLSHVRYTPHLHWADQPEINPYRKLDDYPCSTYVDRMVRDVARYMPAVLEAKYHDSLFEVKTVLMRNEGDDGRPILFERNQGLSGCYSVLGGKIDNIYDVLEKLDHECI